MSGERKPRAKKASPSIHESSGNVFADLGLPESSELLVKAELAVGIVQAIEKRGVTQAKAASVLGVSQADISDLVRGKLKGFSTERLIRFLNALGRDVAIVVSEPRRARAGTYRVIKQSRRTPVSIVRDKR